MEVMRRDGGPTTRCARSPATARSKRFCVRARRRYRHRYCTKVAEESRAVAVGRGSLGGKGNQKWFFPVEV